jgi:hypothetical protein
VAVKLSSVVELAGFGCLVVFAALMYGPAAWAAAGVCLLVVGYGTDDAAFTAKVVDPLRRRWQGRKARRLERKQKG